MPFTNGTACRFARCHVLDTRRPTICFGGDVRSSGRYHSLSCRTFPIEVQKPARKRGRYIQCREYRPCFHAGFASLRVASRTSCDSCVSLPPSGKGSFGVLNLKSQI